MCYGVTNERTPFRTGKFFAEFNEKIPATATDRARVLPHQIASYRRDVEEADKKYFCGWRNNKLENKKVTLKNLEKTRALIDEKTYVFCKDHNISTRWTDEPRFAVRADISLLQG